jgi:hypothetical protein
MDRPRRRVTFALNNRARNLPVDAWDVDIDTQAEPRGVARRCLRAYWREREGELVPLVDGLVPDEVVILERGKVLGRWNIVDEMNARFAATGR